MTESVTGTVGKIITRQDTHLFHFDGDPPNLDAGEVIVTVNESPMPAKIDSVLSRLTGGMFGYSIEPADTQTVVVPASEVRSVSEGDEISVQTGNGSARVEVTR